MTDGGGPYLRVEVNVAAAIVTAEDTILNGDMLDGTMAFGVGITDGPAIASGLVTSDRSTAVLAKQLANLMQAVRVLLSQNLAFLEDVPNGEAMTDHVRETVRTETVEGAALIHYIPEPPAGGPEQ